MARATFDETDEFIDRLKGAVSFMAEFDFHRKRLHDAGLGPHDIDSIDTLREIPPMEPKDLAADYQDHPPFGSMIPDDQSVVRSCFTPSPYMEHRMPVPYTRRDFDINDKGNAEAFRAMGVTADDVVLNTASFTPYPAGWAGGGATEEIGATHLPTGPGGTDEQVDTIRRYDVTTVFGFPSFLMEIASQADPSDLASVERVICTGEPFTAIEGFREDMIAAYGGDVVATDAYGLAEFGGGLVAYESEEMAGLHIPADRVLVEVIDPDTGDLAARGEKGEMVITSLAHHSHPVLRMRTGDLTIFDKRESEYGDYVLPDGVFGRVDDMRKVKGVKVYPTEIQLFLAGIDGVDASNVQFRVARPTGTTDRFTVTVNADPDVVDPDELAAEIRSVTNISVDELIIDEEFELDDGEDVIVDDRT